MSGLFAHSVFAKWDAMSELRKIKPWTRAPCDDCGFEHQATRGYPLVVSEDTLVLCDDCESYHAGYKDGYRDGLKKSEPYVKP